MPEPMPAAGVGAGGTVCGPEKARLDTLYDVQLLRGVGRTAETQHAAVRTQSRENIDSQAFAGSDGLPRRTGRLVLNTTSADVIQSNAQPMRHVLRAPADMRRSP